LDTEVRRIRRRRDAPRAIDTLSRTMNADPALPMAWRMLDGL
jgi:hypothetical protein